MNSLVSIHTFSLWKGLKITPHLSNLEIEILVQAMRDEQEQETFHVTLS